MIINRKKYKRIAFGATTIILGAVIIILILFGFTTPLPLPEEEGILVNFGYDNTGSGQIETQAQAPPEKTIPEKTEAVPATEPADGEEKVLTQDFEDAAAIEKKEKERKKREEQERLEQERKEQERIEREKREQERKEKEQKEKIEAVTKNAFSSGNTNDGSSKSDGNTGDDGNQGTQNGDPGSDNYGEGQGLSDKGIGYSLKGRSPAGGKLPKPRYVSNDEGIVVIRVTVNQKGEVTSASYQAKGSTTTNERLRNAALEAARKARFNTDFNADAYQVGTITYRFVLR